MTASLEVPGARAGWEVTLALTAETVVSSSAGHDQGSSWLSGVFSRSSALGLLLQLCHEFHKDLIPFLCKLGRVFHVICHLLLLLCELLFFFNTIGSD